MLLNSVTAINLHAVLK